MPPRPARPDPPLHSPANYALHALPPTLLSYALGATTLRRATHKVCPAPVLAALMCAAFVDAHWVPVVVVSARRAHVGTPWSFAGATVVRVPELCGRDVHFWAREHDMSGYKNFAIVGARELGRLTLATLLKEQAAGTIDSVVVLARADSGSTFDGDAKVLRVDYVDKGSIKGALAGVDVVISTLSETGYAVQGAVAEAAKEAGVKLFVPSEFGGVTEGATGGGGGLFRAKGELHGELKALGLPYALFYTGPFLDWLWSEFVGLDLASGKVSVGSDGNKQISFTAMPDIARYLTYVLINSPAEQLENRSFRLAGDTKSFNEIFKDYEEKTGKKVAVTYILIPELEARIAANPYDSLAHLQHVWATAGPFVTTDNHLCPNWNPSSVADNYPSEYVPKTVRRSISQQCKGLGE
ncbi:hypothetical protein BC834DRAFT_968042 [Gloeopeniophorella convolvens]|nr:hypothetical protein BC834DRAFT_968042 [Gloeopeniophorella convolvens]